MTVTSNTNPNEKFQRSFDIRIANKIKNLFNYFKKKKKNVLFIEFDIN